MHTPFTVFLLASAVYGAITRRDLVIQTIPGWQSLGCYSDTQSNRTLGFTAILGDNVSDTICQKTCQDLGYAYAGTEYSGQCFCSQSINSVATQKPISDCNMACTGDKTQPCGGPDRINVFTNGTSTVLTPTPTWYDLGCYSDSVAARALPTYVVASKMTVEICQSGCLSAGYTLAGLEWASECYCGNTILNGQGPAQGCDMTCAGNTTQICGAANRLSLYSLTKPADVVSSLPVSSLTSSSGSTASATASSSPVISSTVSLSSAVAVSDGLSSASGPSSSRLSSAPMSQSSSPNAEVSQSSASRGEPSASVPIISSVISVASSPVASLSGQVGQISSAIPESSSSAVTSLSTALPSSSIAAAVSSKPAPSITYSGTPIAYAGPLPTTPIHQTESLPGNWTYAGCWRTTLLVHKQVNNNGFTPLQCINFCRTAASSYDIASIYGFGRFCLCGVQKRIRPAAPLYQWSSLDNCESRCFADSSLACGSTSSQFEDSSMDMWFIKN